MTDLIRWDPYQRMLSLRDAIDRMVEEACPTLWAAGPGSMLARKPWLLTFTKPMRI